MTTDYHKRNIELPHDVWERVNSWHGGQNSLTYSLVSLGMEDYVSCSMIDAAADELEGAGGKYDTPELRADRLETAGLLRMVSFEDGREHRSSEGQESGYATWLMGDDS